MGYILQPEVAQSLNDMCDYIDFCFVGDISLGDSPKKIGLGVRAQSEKMGGQYFFKNIQNLPCKDFMFGNLEGVLSDTGYNKKDFYQAQLRGSPQMVGALVESGFNVLNVANNHMMQYGDVPFTETVSLLNANGIYVVGGKGCRGWHSSPVIIEKNGIKVGVLGYADRDDYGHVPLFSILDSGNIMEDVNQIKSLVDFLVVSLHWGNEFVRAPSKKQKDFANCLLNSDVDVIIGHHPHVIQGVVCGSSKYIFYSLGNFVSDMDWNTRTMEGLVPFLRFKKDPREVNLLNLFKVSIGSDYAPSFEEVSDIDINKIVSMDEGLGSSAEGYSSLIRKQVIINKFLSHVYLLRKFYKYAPQMYVQVWKNSMLSFFRDKTEELRFPKGLK